MHGLVQFLLLLVALGIGNLIYKLNSREPVKVPPETWWGPGDPSKEDKSIVPFKINVPDQTLDDLKNRIKNARDFIPPLEGIQQQYGINTKLLKEIVDFWLTKYDWREREKFLNQFPQFKTSIQGLEIHYIHAKPKNVPSGVKILPLLLLHGWPGSVREFYEMIPLLTTVQKDKDFVFEVIAPSLPGYGFSQAAVRPGLGANKVAVVFKNLMKRLGYEKYYVQGGDWGSAVGSAMATFFPEYVKGLHLNMCMSNSLISKLKLLAGSVWPSLVIDEKNKHKIYPLGDWGQNLLLEFGYMHLQATKPDTVGVGLNDSPVGLAAYIIEKFTTWTNPEWKNRADGGLLERFTYTKLLDNVMIYWITNSITTSMRLYAETMNKEENAFDDSGHILVPSACAVFTNEVVYQPPSLFKDRFPKLIQVNEYDGGHFAAFEVPDILAKDVWLAVSKIENPPPTKTLDDLKNRIKNARDFIPPLEGIQQQYGINAKLLKEIVDFWLTKYDWREREKFLNQFPQFKTSIQGLEIHYIHAKPKNVPSGVKILPLLVLHGWPGSVREFYEMIPLLTTVQKDKDFVFEVIAPSLPGYGFSQAAVRPGLGANKVAVMFKNLMKRLGYEKYYVQGGDWGAIVGSAMATFFPEYVKGFHSNICMSNSLISKLKLLAGSVWPSLVVDEKNKHKLYPLGDWVQNLLLEFGYMHLQATKPDTVGVGLNDSPVGLAAYIIEKFTTWTNPEWKNRADGGLLERFTYTKLLDNVMIYWITNSITTSMRMYAETISKEENLFDDSGHILVPSACAVFTNELVYQPPSIFKDRFPKLVQANEYDGGHFAAFELPDVLAKDVWLAVSKIENPPLTK